MSLVDKILNSKSLREFTNKELLDILQINESVELLALGAICSEILRRMNEKQDILKDT